METGFQSSFIPKKPIVPSGGTRVRTSVSIFMVVAIIIFIATLVSAGLVILYKQSLEKTITDNKAYLKSQQDAFDTNTIKNMIRLDARIESGKAILNSHVAASSIFGLIEDSTLKGVRFKSFDYNFSGSDVTITMKGQADSFSTIALQSDEFAKHKEFREPILSDLSLDSFGSVSFNFTTKIDPSLILYKSVRATN